MLVRQIGAVSLDSRCHHSESLSWFFAGSPHGDVYLGSDSEWGRFLARILKNKTKKERSLVLRVFSEPMMDWSLVFRDLFWGRDFGSGGV